MPEFIPGLDLAEIYYHKAARPVLDAHFPGLPHAAALVGYGSDVLGLDTPVSRDHGWGPRFILFLRPEDLAASGARIFETLRQHLPVQVRGYATHFSRPDPLDNGVRNPRLVDRGPIDPLITLTSLEAHYRSALGIDVAAELSPADWITLSEQALLEETAGRVFHDDLGLESVRARLAYYPPDVWRYLLAAQWALIAQEEAFVGRTWQVGDALGSRVVTARIVERLMRLCFLMERRYAPYSKWFGTAFARLECAPRMSLLLEGALAAAVYAAREQSLASAYTLVAELHNALGITPPLDTRTRTFSGWHALRDGITDLPLDHPRNTRPHQVIFAERFADAISATIQDPQVLALRHQFGSVSQFLVESSNAQQSLAFRRGLADDLLEA